MNCLLFKFKNNNDIDKDKLKELVCIEFEETKTITEFNLEEKYKDKYRYIGFNCNEYDFYQLSNKLYNIKSFFHINDNFQYMIFDFKLGENKILDIIERQINIKREMTKVIEVISKEYDCFVTSRESYIEINFRYSQKEITNRIKETLLSLLKENGFENYFANWVSSYIIFLRKNVDYLDYSKFVNVN